MTISFYGNLCLFLSNLMFNKVSSFKNPSIKFLGFALLSAFKAEKDDVIKLFMAKANSNQKSLGGSDFSDIDDAFDRAIDMTY